MPNEQELQELREFLASIQPTVDKLTASERRKDMEEGSIYTETVDAIPGCEAYVIYEGRRYTLGLEIPASVRPSEHALESTVVTVGQKTIKATLRRQPRSTSYQVRFWNILSRHEDTPQLGAV